jgi:putrescine transport system substrate-binding protein
MIKLLSFRATLAGSVALMAFLAAGAATAKELRIYNWSDYIDEEVLKDFEKKTGIKTVYDVFDSNEMLEAKLLAGSSGYDIVVPTGSFLAKQVKAGVFQKLDKSKLPNLKNMWPLILERTAKHDPDNAYSINYMWGTTGFGYNEAKIKERMADAPVDSWELIFNPDVISKFKDCGIHFLDAPDDVIPAALHYLGLDPNSDKDEDIQKAAELLEKIRPNVQKFHSSEFINALANGDICIAIGYSGDILQARDRAAEAGSNVTVVYSLPKEGAQMWFDQMAIPADAKNVEEAHIFLNYLMEPEVIAKASNYVKYANGNIASKEFLDEEVKGDTSIYPDEETLGRLYVKDAYEGKGQRLITRVWTKILTGQ